jgi:mannose-6-phosphate isomerase
MADLPPLRFEPILRQYLWGGRRLADLGKPLGGGTHYAESWEVVDHGEDQSTVAGGGLAGTALHDLVLENGHALFGRHHPLPQFPLLFKYLDCQQTLSVQVHPNDTEAAKLQPPDFGKTEAWVILAAEPGSLVYAGLKPGVDRSALERKLANGDVEACLHQFEPRVGDCILIEARTAHALGAGLLIAEIQQASDTTYRLFDWNRLDRDGKPRQLHIQEALDTIDYSRGPVEAVTARPRSRLGVENLVTCDKFVIDRWRISGPEPLATEDRFHILSAIEGNVTLRATGQMHLMRRGDTILVPACCPAVELAPRGRAVVLDMYLP